jgi:hypothetical protein
MPKAGKFGKKHGPYGGITPDANTVTSAKIVDATIAAADIGALAVTAAKLNADVCEGGISGGAGSAVYLDLNDLTAATVNVATDSIAIIDADDSNASRKESVAHLADGLVAGTGGLAASSGVISLDIDNLADATIDVAADTICFIDESAAGDPTKLESVADLATGMADGTTITAASGVFSVGTGGVGILQHANDDKHSIFYMGGEIDYGESNAVTVDLGAIGSKATLLGGYWTNTEAAANGDATNTIKLGTATGGGSTIATDLTVTLANTADGQSNTVGMIRAVLPNGTTSVDMASTVHLWLDCADDVAGTRSAGKVKVFLILQKSA